MTIPSTETPWRIKLAELFVAVVKKPAKQHGKISGAATKKSAPSMLRCLECRRNRKMENASTAHATTKIAPHPQVNKPSKMSIKLKLAGKVSISNFLS